LIRTDLQLAILAIPDSASLAWQSPARAGHHVGVTWRS
jgi:hypothetical protein